VTDNQLTRDRVNLDFGERLAVAVFLAVTFAAFFVKHDDFVAFHMADYAGANACAFDVGRADGHFAVVLDEMHGVEGDFVTFIGCQPVDEDLLTFLNFELLTGDGNNCEHIENQKFGGNNSPFFKKAGKGTSTRLKNQAGFKICHFVMNRHCVI
jgi:hypothetical protein